MMELEYNDGDKNMEEDPMQILCDVKDNIWNSLPLKNLKLKAKICQVAHSHMIEVLTLSLMSTDSDTSVY